MRRGNYNAFISDNDGIYIGINLGWDFTAEHEWGIDGLKRNFGLEGVTNGIIKKRLGIEARRVTLLPPHFALIEKSGYTYLISAKYDSPNELSKKDLDRMIGAYWTFYRKDDPEVILQTAWDEGSFGIAAKGKEGREYLKELLKAFNENDVIITFGHDANPFSNAGLMLLIASKLPQDYIDSQKEADLDQIALDKASDKTGIIKRIAKSDRNYFACLPRWASSIKSTKDGEIKTKYDVIYWLNPQEQKIYDSAWCTVEDLDDWIAGKGKIVKESA